MTVMLLALLFSESALNASDAGTYRLDDEPYVEPRSRTREWKPGVDGWKIERTECPAFFKEELEGFGAVRVGPTCTEEEIPYAL